MKRVELIRDVERREYLLSHHGAKHDWYRNPNTGVSQPVPRHREINERLARKIIQVLGEERRS